MIINEVGIIKTECLIGMSCCGEFAESRRLIGRELTQMATTSLTAPADVFFTIIWQE